MSYLTDTLALLDSISGIVDPCSSLAAIFPKASKSYLTDILAFLGSVSGFVIHALAFGKIPPALLTRTQSCDKIIRERSRLTESRWTAKE